MAMITILLAAAGASQAPVADAQAQQPEPQICRRITVSNTRMGTRRICKTRAEWLATARNPETDMSVTDGMDPRAHNPQTGDTGGMSASSGPR